MVIVNIIVLLDHILNARHVILVRKINAKIAILVIICLIINQIVIIADRIASHVMGIYIILYVHNVIMDIAYQIINVFKNVTWDIMIIIAKLVIH
jgi:hypothetical protein